MLKTDGDGEEGGGEGGLTREYKAGGGGGLQRVVGVSGAAASRQSFADVPCSFSCCHAERQHR